MASFRFQKGFAFSLIELLVVMAIIALLMALSAPVLNSVLLGTQLARSGQLVHDQLALAAQLSLSHNVPVEVRLYRYTEPNAPEPREGTAAIQLFEIQDDGSAVPASPVRFLPEAFFIYDQETYSNISGLLPLQDGEIPIPRVGTNYHYRRFFFRPDGTTDLTEYDFMGKPPYLTVARRTVGTEVPANYYTIQIQPETGHLNVLRP